MAENSKKVKVLSITTKYYPPSSIFLDEGNHPQEMAGTHNLILAKSFYHSRYTEDHELRTDNRAKRFDRNAGAVQLYNKDSMTIYQIPGHESKNYNYVSYGNKEFKRYTPVKCSYYGHSERILMKNILDDLIEYYGDFVCPSDPLNSRSNFEHEKEYEVLKKLTDEPTKYKDYLEGKSILVKMWSERPMCESPRVGGVGGTCKEFVDSIFPRGSQFGFIVEDYIQADNQNGGPKVETAFEEFKNAYLSYLKINTVSNQDIVGELKKTKE